MINMKSRVNRKIISNNSLVMLISVLIMLIYIFPLLSPPQPYRLLPPSHSPTLPSATLPYSTPPPLIYYHHPSCPLHYPRIPSFQLRSTTSLSYPTLSYPIIPFPRIPSPPLPYPTLSLPYHAIFPTLPSTTIPSHLGYPTPPYSSLSSPPITYAILPSPRIYSPLLLYPRFTSLQLRTLPIP